MIILQQYDFVNTFFEIFLKIFLNFKFFLFPTYILCKIYFREPPMKIKIGFFAVIMIASLLLSSSSFSLAALLAAFLHELGHILIAKLLKIELKELSLGLFGAGLMTSNRLLSFNEEILLCIAGPAINLICFFIMNFFKLSDSSFGNYFAISSLFLGILNLLPISDFDGGRILSAILGKVMPPKKIFMIMKLLSFLLIFSLWAFSLYLILRVAFSLSLFLFSSAIFVRIFISETK